MYIYPFQETKASISNRFQHPELHRPHTPRKAYMGCQVLAWTKHVESAEQSPWKLGLRLRLKMVENGWKWLKMVWWGHMGTIVFVDPFTVYLPAASSVHPAASKIQHSSSVGQGSNLYVNCVVQKQMNNPRALVEHQKFHLQDFRGVQGFNDCSLQWPLRVLHLCSLRSTQLGTLLGTPMKLKHGEAPLI